MTKHPILILGGYGNFGKRIAALLARDGVSIVIAGRNAAKAQAGKNTLAAECPAARIDTACFDAEENLSEWLERLRPAAVINTCGPFQAKDYRIAEACIRRDVHYIDLADGRDFVTGIARLDIAARERGVSVIGGASTVPGLSSAVLEEYRHEFRDIESLRYGISPGQKAERGLATTQAVLSYAGKPLRDFPGAEGRVYGWQDLYRQPYPEIGMRWMANCEIPDLDILPAKYGIRRIRFSAGMEVAPVHFGIWALSWLVRLGLKLDLPKHAAWLLRASNWFDRFGTGDGGMHMIIRGRDREGKPRERKWFIIAKNGDGPYIPCVPAAVLAKKIVSGEKFPAGAYPCAGLVSLKEYMDALRGLNVKIVTEAA